MTPKAISFKGFDLQADPYKVVRAPELYNSPELDIIAYELARSDGAESVFRRYKSRAFTLNGNISVDTPADLEPAIDTLKLAILNQIGDVAATWGSGLRYFNSECKNVIVSLDQADITRCGWSAQFYMKQPFSTDNVTRDLMTAVASNTVGSFSVSTNNVGTYFAAPYIVITLTGLEPNTSDISITIGNPATNENMTITGQFADGDILTIDTLKKQIFKNSTLMPGVGNFPTWMPGAGIITYGDTASSRTINMTATYIARYL